MEQPNGNPCPECGAPRNSDNTPSCACTIRASDALRDARTAEAAAAEDFDPLRMRPDFVELLRRVEAYHCDAAQAFRREGGDVLLGLRAAAQAAA